MRKCIRAWREYEKRLRWWSDFQKEYIKRMGELKNNAEAFVFASETLDKTIHLKKLKDAIDAGRKLRKILLDMKKSERIRAGELKSNAEALVFASETLDKIIKYRKDMKKSERIRAIEEKIRILQCEIDSLKDNSVECNTGTINGLMWENNDGDSFVLNSCYYWELTYHEDEGEYALLTPTRK